MTKWYTYVNDEVQGPYDDDEIVQQISSDTLVCQAGSEDWKHAEDIGAFNFGSPDDTDDSDLGEEPEASEGSDSTDTSNRSTSTEQSSSSPETAVTDDVEVGDIEPTLADLKQICDQAGDDDLVQEYELHWDDYDRREQRIIRHQMIMRDIWYDVADQDENGDDSLL